VQISVIKESIVTSTMAHYHDAEEFHQVSKDDIEAIIQRGYLKKLVEHENPFGLEGEEKETLEARNYGYPYQYRHGEQRPST